MHPLNILRPHSFFCDRHTAFFSVANQRRTALLLATALTSSLVLVPALTVPVRASDVNINGTNETVIGSGGGATGTKGSPWDFTGSLAVGYSSSGTLTITEGGTVSTPNNVTIGRFDDVQGTVTVDGAGSKLTMGADLIVGYDGHGKLVISNGGAVSNTLAKIYGGMDGSGTGAVTVTGADSTWTNSRTLAIAFFANSDGTLTISEGGTVTSVGRSYVGNRGTGTATVTGAGSKWTNTGEIRMGHTGTSTLTIADGGEVSASNLVFGGFSASTLNIGAASGDAAVAAGTLSAATVAFGRSRQKIVFNHTDTDYTFATAISGAGSVEFLSGTTKLTGANTYTGGTTISAGTLQIGDGGTTGSLSGDVTNNSAMIFSRTDALNYGGDISGTGSLTKSGTGTLTLTGANSFSGGTTISAGTLQIGDGGTSGSLSGDVVNNGAMIFNRSDALTYDGDISGTGALTKSGAETLILTGANTYTGGTTISAGTLQVGDGGSLAGDIINNSAMVFNSSTAQSLSSVLSGTGTLTKSGTGTLTLTGNNTYSGGTTVSAGKLVVNGSTGEITLNGGTLSGSGTVGTVAANSGSTIAPGNSIGTLNVTGDTSFATGSTYAVEVDKNGNSDKIAATGTVTIDTGATVSILAENGTDDGSTYAPSTAYTIVTADTAVTGTFDVVTETFAFLDASLSYDPNNVYLKLLRNNYNFASAANTANQRATAEALDTLGSGNTIYDAAIVLNSADARAAFDSLSGEIHSSATNLLIQNSHFAADAVGARLRGAFGEISGRDTSLIVFNGAGEFPEISQGSVAWGHTYGNWGQTLGNGNTAQINHTSGGGLMGADAIAFGGWRAGLFAGFGNTRFSVEDRASSGNADSYTMGAYAGRQFGAGSVQVGTTFAAHDVSSTRNVKVGSLSNTLSSSRMGVTGQIFGEANYTFDMLTTRFQPFAAGRLVYQYSDEFTETGGAAALRVAGQSQTFGITTLGARLEQELAPLGAYSASLTGSLGWRHVFGDVNRAATMKLSDGEVFGVVGAPLERDTALIEAGVTLDLSSRASASFNYQGELSQKTQNHGIKARFAGKF